MNKQELEELRRLEEELLAAEYDPEDFDGLDHLEDAGFSDILLDAWNSDALDVDLDNYTEALIQPVPRRSAGPVAAIVLLSVLVLFCAMKLLGVV